MTDVVLSWDELLGLKQAMPRLLQDIHPSEVDKWIRDTHPRGVLFPERAQLLESVRRLLVDRFDRGLVLQAREIREESTTITTAQEALEEFQLSMQYPGSILEHVLLWQVPLTHGVQIPMWHYYCSLGDLEASGCSARKDIAMEMVSGQMLEMVGAANPDFHIPPFHTDQAIFIDADIMERMQREATRRQLPVSVDLKITPAGKGGRVHHEFVCTYTVGTDRFRAFHHSMELCQRIAANSAFIFFTGTSAPATRFFSQPPDELGKDILATLNAERFTNNDE